MAISIPSLVKMTRSPRSFIGGKEESFLLVAKVLDLSATKTILQRYTRCPVPGARCPVPGARCPVPGARCPVPGARCPVPGARCPVPGARCPLPAARCPLPAARCPLIGAWCRCPGTVPKFVLRH